MPVSPVSIPAMTRELVRIVVADQPVDLRRISLQGNKSQYRVSLHPGITAKACKGMILLKSAELCQPIDVLSENTLRPFLAQNSGKPVDAPTVRVSEGQYDIEQDALAFHISIF